MSTFTPQAMDSGRLSDNLPGLWLREPHTPCIDITSIPNLCLETQHTRLPSQILPYSQRSTREIHSIRK